MKTSITKIMLATSLMAFGALTANADDKFELSGEIRTRGEMSGKDFDTETDPNSYTLMRTRLNAKFMPLDHIDVMLTFQDSRTFGTELSTLSDNESLDLHQAFVNWKSINGSKFGLMAGRMGLAFANQRLIGKVGWSNVGRAFDGGGIYYKGESFTAHLVEALVVETGQKADIGDKILTALHFDVKAVDGLSLQPFTYVQCTTSDDGSEWLEAEEEGEEDILLKSKTKLDYLGTSGAYLKYSMENGLWLEADGAFQYGKTNAGTKDVSAFMFGANIGMLTGDEDMKFGGKVGIDMLSGDDGKDADKDKTFNTLYATNHKFYGHMDYFLGSGNWGTVVDDEGNTTVNGNGLQDIFIGGIYKRKNLGLTVDFHILTATEDIVVGAETETAYGNELDVDFWWKFNSAIKWNTGLGIFMPGKVFEAKKGEDNAVWFYSGLTINF